MNDGKRRVKEIQLLTRHSRTLADANLPYGTPSHGGNTGSNPVGDASMINYLESFCLKLPTYFPQRRRWTVPDGSSLKLAFAEGWDTAGCYPSCGRRGATPVCETRPSDS